MSGHTEFPVIPTHLIIVCCHGVYTGGPCKGASEDEWLIAPFQAGETPTFTAHMRLGLEILESDPSSVLILSGGPTRPETELSEATSYLQLGVDNGFWGYELSEREVLCEQRAMDSYHNVLYSLTRFFAHYETWPGRVTVVSHEFKKARIIEGHCAAIGLRNVGFAGIDPPAKSDPSALAQEKRGIQQALVDWQEDPHGRGPKLAGKRRQRNIHNTWQGIMPKDHNHSGGLVTRGEDGEETLVDDAPRPWNT